MGKGGIITNNCFRQLYSSKCLKGFPQQLLISLPPDVEADFTWMCKPAIHWCNKKRPGLFKCCEDAEMMCILTSSSTSNKHSWFHFFWTRRCCRKPLSQVSCGRGEMASSTLYERMQPWQWCAVAQGTSTVSILSLRQQCCKHTATSYTSHPLAACECTTKGHQAGALLSLSRKLGLSALCFYVHIAFFCEK